MFLPPILQRQLDLSRTSCCLGTRRPREPLRKQLDRYSRQRHPKLPGQVRYAPPSLLALVSRDFAYFNDSGLN
jgi:hypothetical protein